MAIHPSAIVSPKAELDSTVDVGPYCIIDAHVRIAARCRLLHGVYITGWTSIDEDCTLHPGVIVGHAPQDTKYDGERSYCRIGKGTIIREYATIHRGTLPESETIVGKDCFLLAGSHIAHNCVVGNRVTLINNALLAGHVQVGDRVTMGGAAGVHQFVRIGELAMIAGNARVPLDVAPFAITDVDGRIAGLNRVGLRRAKLSPDEITDVHNAYRMLFGQRLQYSQALEQAAATVTTPAGHRLIQFLREKTHRGFAGRTRRRRKPQADQSTG